VQVYIGPGIVSRKPGQAAGEFNRKNQTPTRKNGIRLWLAVGSFDWGMADFWAKSKKNC